MSNTATTRVKENEWGGCDGVSKQGEKTHDSRYNSSTTLIPCRSPGTETTLPNRTFSTPRDSTPH